MSQIKNNSVLIKKEHAMNGWRLPIFDEVISTRGGYIINGKKYPRVTTILNSVAKPGLNFWYGRHGTEKAKEIMEQKSEFGSVFHKIVELILNNQPVNLSHYAEDMGSCVSQFLNWYKTKKFGRKYTEVLLLSEKHNYAGTCDFVGEIDDELIMADWKTSSFIQDTYIWQLAAYLYAFTEMTGIKIKKAFIFNTSLKHSAVIREFTYDELSAQFRFFLSAKHLHLGLRQKWMEIGEQHTVFDKTSGFLE
jgi:CRISPR/Cas system-associated exonuclease Cas4 (RecB family)